MSVADPTPVASPCVSDDCRDSHCVVCDAHTGECNHTGARYLAPIVYETVYDKNWKRLGLSVPDHERERWDAPPLRATQKPKPNEHERDVDELVAELGDVFYLDPPLEARLRSAHAVEPLRVSRLAAATIAGASDGSLHTPAAFLAKRLVGIEPGKTKAT